MKKVFWENPYQARLATKVFSVHENRVLLEETIAFSFSGGQESDRAYINGYQVINSEMDKNLIFYTLPNGHGLNAGTEVIMEIDWQRRYKLMRLHFAAELVLELVTRKLDIKKIGAHIAEDKARIDFVYDKNISSIFEGILADYNKIILSDMTIKTGFTDEALQRRYWEIDGFTQVPCGGTHVKSTAEVGCITLRRVNTGAGKERIEIRLLTA